MSWFQVAATDRSVTGWGASAGHVWNAWELLPAATATVSWFQVESTVRAVVGQPAPPGFVWNAWELTPAAVVAVPWFQVECPVHPARKNGPPDWVADAFAPPALFAFPAIAFPNAPRPVKTPPGFVSDVPEQPGGVVPVAVELPTASYRPTPAAGSIDTEVPAPPQLAGWRDSVIVVRVRKRAQTANAETFPVILTPPDNRPVGFVAATFPDGPRHAAADVGVWWATAWPVPTRGPPAPAVWLTTAGLSGWIDSRGGGAWAGLSGAGWDTSPDGSGWGAGTGGGGWETK